MPKANNSYTYHEWDYDGFYIDYRFTQASEPISIPRHKHNKHEIMLCECGISNMIIGKSLYHGEGHYLIYAPADSIHEIINNCSDGYRRYCFSVDPSYFGDDRTVMPQLPFILELEDELFEVLSDIAALLYKYYGTDSHSNSIPKPKTSVTDINPTRLAYLLQTFFGELKPIISERLLELSIGNRSAKSRYICEVCSYINEHYDEKISLDRIASEYFISRAKLTADFRELTNLSVGDYITSVRLNRSIKLLDGELSISEIAQSCGFSSSSYFISCFARCFGMTPAKYRASGGNKGKINTIKH